MAAKKKPGSRNKKSAAAPAAARTGSKVTRTRLQRSDEDKIRLVRQVMESGNQSAEIKKLGIYPNQFYDWKKKYGTQLSGVVAPTSRTKVGRVDSASRGAADEAKAYIQGKAALLDRLRSQRSELDQLISQLEG